MSGIEALAWDSAFLGFAVARVTPGSDETDAALLARAAREGHRLLYWCTAPDTAPPDLAGSAFTWSYSDPKRTYASPLGDEGVRAEPAVETAELPAGPAPDDLLDLALAAGAHSRFRLDPRIPEERWSALYQTWMARSASRQIADTVIVALADAVRVGFVTLSERGGEANIGLIAVRDAYRGRCVGSSLMAAAHGWMRVRGAARATVATQDTNRGACRFYERCGYALQARMSIHHLWHRELAA